jgi:hypothetical protein
MRHAAWNSKSQARMAEENLVDAKNQYQKLQKTLPVETQEPLGTCECLQVFQQLVTNQLNKFTISQLIP